MKRKPPCLLRFHGVRGSRPTHQIELLGFGGNTTCIEIDTGLDFILAIDGGSGLQHISQRLGNHPNHRKIHLLITHTHWDHVLFLPFLKQLHNPDCEIHIHAPDVGAQPFQELFNLLFKHGRLPIPRESIKSKLVFHRLEPGVDFLIEGKVKVSSIQVNHQHMTLGYKLGLFESSIAIITDVATIATGNFLGQGMKERAALIGKKSFEAEYNDQLTQFLNGVDSLVFDTHFNSQNLKSDWGHATPEIALELCARAKIKRLFMFHHAPEDSDRRVAMKQIYARNLALKHGIEVINAREEDEWPLASG
jgi:ribonuclease BN (tRNA processing enzyme)